MSFITKDPTTEKEHSLILEAQRRYPPGTTIIGLDTERVRGNFRRIITTHFNMSEELRGDELLKEAERRYPKGTKAMSFFGDEFIVHGDHWIDGPRVMVMSTGGNWKWIKKSGEWIKILSLPAGYINNNYEVH